MSSPRVRVYKLQDRSDRGVPSPHIVRWEVGGREHTKAHTHKAAADRFRSQLIAADASGEPFDVGTGEPRSWKRSDLTVAQWAHRWVRANWSTWAPRSRRSTVEALYRALPVIVPDRAPDAPDGIRESIAAWLASDTVACPAWLARWSLPLADVDRSVCVELVGELSTGDDGTLLKPATSNRYRAVAKAMLTDAEDAGHIAKLEWPRTKRARGKTKVKLTVRTATLPTLPVARATIDRLVNHQPGSRAYRVIAYTMLLAGMRPSEVLALTVEQLELPEAGWGMAYVHQANKDAGPRYTALGEAEGDTKTSVDRDVPLCPELVAILRDWVGERTTGRLVETRSGKAPSVSNIDRAWRRARGDHGWVLYDLRHTCATVWLAAGVPIGEAARRLGHSPETLLRVYAGVLDGDAATANARIEAALR
jgi:integrase